MPPVEHVEHLKHMDPIVALGVLFVAAAVLSVLFGLVRQSSIVAYIVVGIVAGSFHERIHISEEMIHWFTELGIILLLFMAGIEIDFGSFFKRWKVVLTNGLGQILFTAVLGATFAFFLLGIPSPMAAIYFGLCLTFSSTIIVIGALKSKKAMESLHGQITLGIMALQDVTAVMALVVLNTMSGEGSMAVAIGIVLLKMIILIISLAILARFVLPRVFRYLATQSGLLFLGSLGWVLGIAAACKAVDFSPEIGAFFAGAAISAPPYRLEVQDKVESMKDFGIVLFFLALGFNLKIDATAVKLIGPVLLTAAVVLFATPMIMLAIGFLNRAKSRPTFYTGTFINQISEFSLILATLCLGKGVFSQETFTLVTLATVVTMFFSSFGHAFMDNLYGLFKTQLSFLDKRSRMGDEDLADLEDHIVIVKYNEMAEQFIDYYLSASKRVLLIDIDPDVYLAMSKRHENLICMYADIFDPDTWEEARIDKAYAFVSCMVEGQEAELAVLNWMNDRGLFVPFLAATDSRPEALELYHCGAAFVIQTEELAAEHMRIMLDEYGAQINDLRSKGQEYHESLLAMKNQITKYWS